jgi:hypothetical protein
MHFRFLAILTTFLLACEIGPSETPVAVDTTKGPSGPPAWAGLYAISADSARDCHEGPIPYPCTCAQRGYHEGTLDLKADTTGLPQGALVVRECHPDLDPTCGPQKSLTVLPSYLKAVPPPLAFCAGRCPGEPPDTGWYFDNIVTAGDTLRGRYRHPDSDGIRGCGQELGAFIAIRQ